MTPTKSVYLTSLGSPRGLVGVNETCTGTHVDSGETFLSDSVSLPDPPTTPEGPSGRYPDWVETGRGRTEDTDVGFRIKTPKGRVKDKKVGR